MPRLLSSSKRFYMAGFLLAGFLLSGLLIVIISARGTAWAGNAAQFIVIEDTFGRKITVNIPVQRIVVLNSDALEVLRSMGAQDLVKGVYSEIVKDGAFFREFLDRPRVGSWKNANAELIADLNPAIVIAYENNPGTELEKQLSSFGIQVLRLNFYKLGTIAKEIRTLGKIIGREQQGETLRAWYGQKLDAIQKRLDKVKEKPLVYVESYSAFHTAGPGSGGHDMCVYAGGKNLADEFKVPYSEVTSEWVISKQPDIIFKTSAWGNGFERNDRVFFNHVRDEMAARPSWNLIQAVKNGRVHVLDSGIWTGPRAVIGVAYMAKCIYPRLFDDLDPEQIHKEYLESLQRIPYQGVYISENLSGGSK
ncbi:ABC transporter substrate-binding protein [Desulfobacula phenolica]|uniref:Iron complex transport system substrate-binding protein n=1 Tax=Desulfobacula phenolica TaxID=90732 RepID=A0A1H2ID09_9BACT|nr:ABC transporter substrate-binding protein [Desulfobacula phenolica]SDU41826.1 iron complex transport system substrate-binding protein [Desulfobacula phenolica]